jgi:hypothetical protein
MSREGAPSHTPKPERAAGTPIWVWVVYALGVLAAIIIAFAVLFTAGAHFLGGAGYRVSPLAFVVWGGLLVIALVTWYTRRRR